MPPEDDRGDGERAEDEDVDAGAAEQAGGGRAVRRRARRSLHGAGGWRRWCRDDGRPHATSCAARGRPGEGTTAGPTGPRSEPTRSLYCVTVTKLPDTPRCAYCRRPFAPGGRPRGAGRPATYCKRSHRQRAYEARRRATRAALPAGQVVVSQAELDRVHDRLYALEAALDDVAADLADVPASASERARARAFEAALAHLRSVAEDLRGVLVEPVIN